MNVPDVIDACIAKLKSLDLVNVDVCDGGYLISRPPEKSINLFGTEEGDEEWAAIGGPNEKRLRYSLGLQATVFSEGLEAADLKRARDEAWDIYSEARHALSHMVVGGIDAELPDSVEQNIKVEFNDLVYQNSSKARIVHVSGYVRVVERGER